MMAVRWWVFLVRGLCGIAVGIVAFTQPLVTLFALIVAWGALAIADGAAALWAGWTDRYGDEWLTPLAISGVVSVLAAFAALMWPGITALVLLAIVASWSIVRGMFEVWAAIRLRRLIANEWLLALNGLLSVVFGMVLLARPGAGLITIVYLIGGFAIVSGVLLVSLSIRLRRVQGHALAQ
jgi:uncharacterized membrane protein HdeD (DUF308 family)